MRDLQWPETGDKMLNELLGEGVPEKRGGGSGVWSREEMCPLGQVGATYWRLDNKPYTELYIRGHGGSSGFPRIFLLAHVVECQTADLFNMYISNLFKLGTPDILVGLLKEARENGRRAGTEAAQQRMRSALGIDEA